MWKWLRNLLTYMHSNNFQVLVLAILQGHEAISIAYCCNNLCVHQMDYTEGPYPMMQGKAFPTLDQILEVLGHLYSKILESRKTH